MDTMMKYVICLFCLFLYHGKIRLDPASTDRNPGIKGPMPLSRES